MSSFYSSCKPAPKQGNKGTREYFPFPPSSPPAAGARWWCVGMWLWNEMVRARDWCSGGGVRLRGSIPSSADSVAVSCTPTLAAAMGVGLSPRERTEVSMGNAQSGGMWRLSTKRVLKDTPKMCRNMKKTTITC